MDKERKVIVITGCSSGIGLDAAITLSRRGYQVIASCRKTEDFEKLQQSGLDAILLDLDNTASIDAAFKEIQKLGKGRIDVLINNAGYGQVGALEDIPGEVLLAQFQTNVFGLMAISRLVIPVMRKQGEGRIINISSVLGVVSLPFKGAYNASKYALEGLSDTLRLELQPSGIKVITIEPGPIQSLWADTLKHSFKHIDLQHSVFKDNYEGMLTNLTQKKEASFFTKKSSAVTKKLIHAIEAKYPRPKYQVTFVAGLLIFLKRILPVRVMDQFLLYCARQ